MFKFLKNTNLAKHYFSFLLTLLALSGVLVLSWFKGISVEILIPSILGIYVGSRTVEKTMAVNAASKDPNSNTRDVIKDLQGGS